MFRYSEIAADLQLGREGFMNQIQESLIHITQTAAESSGKSESEPAAGLVSQFTMKDGTEVSLRSAVGRLAAGSLATPSTALRQNISWCRTPRRTWRKSPTN